MCFRWQYLQTIPSRPFLWSKHLSCWISRLLHREYHYCQKLQGWHIDEDTRQFCWYLSMQKMWDEKGVLDDSSSHCSLHPTVSQLFFPIFIRMKRFPNILHPNRTLAIVHENLIPAPQKCNISKRPPNQIWRKEVLKHDITQNVKRYQLFW